MSREVPVRFCERREVRSLPATHLVILVAGERHHARALIAQTETVLAPLGLTLSVEKTSTAHIDEGIEFLGWRIQRQPGRDGRPRVYTYPVTRVASGRQDEGQGPLSRSPERLLTLGFDPARFPTEPPACYRASWQLPGRDSHPLATA